MYKVGDIVVRTKDRAILTDRFCESQITGTKGFIFKVLEVTTDSLRYEIDYGAPFNKCRHATLNEIEAFNSRGIYNIDQIDICPKDTIIVRTFFSNMIGLKQKGDIFKTTLQSLNNSAKYEKGNIFSADYRFATNEERMAYFSGITNISEVKYEVALSEIKSVCGEPDFIPEFPSSGYYHGFRDSLVKFLEKRCNNTRVYSPRYSGIAWSNSSWGYITTTSEKPEYSWNYLKKIINNNKLNTNKNENNRIHQGVTNQRREQGNGLYIPKLKQSLTISSRLTGYPQRISKCKTKLISRMVKGEPFKF